MNNVKAAPVSSSLAMPVNAVVNHEIYEDAGKTDPQTDAGAHALHQEAAILLFRYFGALQGQCEGGG